MLSFVFIFLFVLTIAIFYKSLRKIRPIPKGLKDLPHENGLPIIGLLHQVRTPFCIHFANMGRKFGPLFRVRLGVRDVVVLNNYDIIKKALKDNGDIFAGRFNIRYFSEITRGVGILFHDGQMWAKQRAYILNVFREFGVNTSRYVDIIQDECSILLDYLEQRNEKKMSFGSHSSTFSSNVILKFLINKRLEIGSDLMKDYDHIISKMTKTTDIFQILSLMFPFLDNSTLFFKFITTVGSEWRTFDRIHQFIRDEIDEHLEKLDFNSKGEDLIDRFLIEQRRMKTKTGNVDSFTEWQLIRTVAELLVAGYETLSTTLAWSLMFMCKYPEIQDKVYSEIMDKIGNKEPSMNDKVDLVYIQAVMDETYRMSSVLPLALTHKTLEDCSIDGYFIPKGSIVFPNLYACHYDPNTWEDPMTFNPRRFLSLNNNGELKYAPREDLIPFGLGKRQCLGESLAKMEYFITFTRLLQKFKVGFCEEMSEKKYKEVLLSNDGMIRQCLIQSFTFTIRN